MSCQLICTGWYASDKPRDYVTHGDDFIRGTDFRPLWWKSLDTFARPEKVLIVDSASPVKPDDHKFTTTDCEYINLMINPGHAQNCSGHYSGCMAAIMLGMSYALHNDVDFFLYVEQDALLYGDNIVEEVKKQLLKKDYVFGQGSGKMIQQSIFAINKKGLRRFLAALNSINYTDHQVNPEWKFMLASSALMHFPLSTLLGLYSWDNPRFIRRMAQNLLFPLFYATRDYTFLPFGYGRVRPLNFSDKTFYFQQGDMDEVRKYRVLTGF